jgi:uncharacterized membrane protein
MISKLPFFRLTVLFVSITSFLFVFLMIYHSRFMPKDLTEHPLVEKLYFIVGIASLLFVLLMALVFKKAQKQMPIYFLSLTVFKLGLFIALIAKEENLPFNVRLAILIPILLFLIVEKTYGYFLFQQLSIKKSNDI